MRGDSAVLLALVAASLLPQRGSAMIHHLDYVEDSSRVFAIELFGFYSSGLINITVFDLVKPPAMALGAGSHQEMGIFVRKVESQANAQTIVEESLATGRCLINAPQNLYSIRLRDQTSWRRRTTLVKRVAVGQAGLYLIAFSRCDSSPDSAPISFKVDAEFSNPGLAAGSLNFLSAGQSGLPTLFGALFATYCFMLWRWRVHLAAHPTKVHNIHNLMTTLLALKSCQMFFESVRYHYIQLAGVAPGWTAVFYVFTFLKSMMLFTVILLIGTGWSLLKHHITPKEKNIIAGVLVLQVLDNLAMVVVHGSAPGSAGWLTWHDILHLVDILCCCAILFPIVWSIRHLRQAAGADGKAAQNLQKLAQFRQFYIVVVVYIYFTRIAVFLLGATLPFQLEWLKVFFDEGAAVMFYGAVGFKFRPGAENPYILVRQDRQALSTEAEFGMMQPEDSEDDAFELSHGMAHSMDDTQHDESDFASPYASEDEGARRSDLGGVV